jgi:hypothetical protein
MTTIPKIVKKIGSTGYVRPTKTFTDNLTPDEIEAKLEGYEQADINQVSIGTHVRYFELKDGVRKFRLGGLLLRNEGLPDYVILSNGDASWSAQVKDTIFFKKMTPKALKEENDTKLTELQLENSKLKQEIKYLMGVIKQNKIKINI